MCGIVGVITGDKWGFNKEALDSFELMLYMDTLRGEDSTGVFLVERNGNVHIAKQVGDGAAFLRSKEWKDLRGMAFSSGWALIGHNRKATKGSITDENAHPFWVDDKIVLVHNGTVNNHKKMADTEVDSHAIANAISKSTDVGTTIQEIDGAFALVWCNADENTVSVVRNDERPLHHNMTKGTWLISSEADILEFAVNRAGAKLDKKTVQFPVGSWHTWQRKGDETTLNYEQLKFKENKTYTSWNVGKHFASAYSSLDDVLDDVGTTAGNNLVKVPNNYFANYLLKYKTLDHKQSIMTYQEMFDLRTNPPLMNGRRVTMDVIDSYKCDITTGEYVLGEVKVAGKSILAACFVDNEELITGIMNGTKFPYIEGEIDNHHWQPMPEAGGGFPILWLSNPSELTVECC